MVPRSSKDGETPEFACYEKSQGYVAKSYGGLAKVLQAFQTSDAQRDIGIRGGGEDGAVGWPEVKQKAPIAEVFDAWGQMHTNGAHQPLLFWVGGISRRSFQAASRREARATTRDFGPGSPKLQ